MTNYSCPGGDRGEVRSRSRARTCSSSKSSSPRRLTASALAKPSRLIPECSVLMGFIVARILFSDTRGTGRFGDSSACDLCCPALFCASAAASTTLTRAYAPRETLRNLAS